MRPGCCKHFNGIMNKCCRAGVSYRDVTPEPDAPGYALRKPCWTKPFGSTPIQLAEFAKRGTCEKYEEPTADDLREHDRVVNQIVAQAMKADAVIGKVKHEHAGNNWAGVETCPVCGGKLHMSHAAYNGHTAGKCETADCLNWME
jgi:hypothetical protein